ncbi:ComEC/Rec2 family competence protein [uncultured Tenacibaculum sp.]|uniref:ComEC/Rec2 family competence protein n=1 Tax=uncultured Tenacibaculum sp. TaxID=174713 RepID=UPI002605E470|nr:ComEC/Rec2 family competence protein [uncultured Tenacibaculum sp.]
MKNLLRYLPTYILLCIVLGIYTQYTYTIFDIRILISLGGLWICFFFIFLLRRSSIKFILLFSLGFFLIGNFAAYVNNPKLYDKHYTNQKFNESSILIRIKEQLKSNLYNHRFIGEIIQVNNTIANGDIIVNLNLKKNKDSILYKTLIVPKAKLTAIKTPKNPHEFNYKAYLKQKGIFHQVFINNNYTITDQSSYFSLLETASQIRNRIESKLQKHSFTKEQRSIMNALLLGQRREVSNTLKESYTKAGAIHILAISGLHIGIILYLLNFVLQWLLFFKKGKLIRGMIIVLLLWIFAFITGLSPSVVRATTMFTFVVIRSIRQVKQPIEFSLISSMIFILLIQPLLLFSIGFQLSYLAVFGIIWIQPLLFKIWNPKFKITRKFWELTTVSVAAQIGTLPISLYYFHQIPGLFLIANLIIIPFLSIILGFGFLILMLAYINYLPSLFVKCYGGIISIMNSIVNWISSYEEFVLTNLNMPFINMILWYMLILISIVIFNKLKVKYIIILLTGVLSIQATYMYQKYETNTRKEFIVFHQAKKSITAFRNKTELIVMSNLDQKNIYKTKFLQSYLSNEKINRCEITPSQDYFKLSKHEVLVVDSLGIYPNMRNEKLIILLKHAPKINLSRLIRDLNPIQIVADGTNYKSYIKHWKEICKKEKTPFHTTYEDGAYILKE